jgi:hypothetical protein
MIATRVVLKNALAAFARGVPPHPSAAHARDVLEVVAGCYLSAATGQQVPLDASANERLRNLRMGVPIVGGGR